MNLLEKLGQREPLLIEVGRPMLEKVQKITMHIRTFMTEKSKHTYWHHL